MAGLRSWTQIPSSARVRGKENKKGNRRPCFCSLLLGIQACSATTQGDVRDEGTRTGVQWGARIHSQQPTSREILVERCSCSTGAAVLWQPREKSSLGIHGVLLSPGSGVSPECHLAAESTARCPRGKLMQDLSN